MIIQVVTEYFPVAGAILVPHLMSIPTVILIKNEANKRWYMTLKKPSWIPPDWVNPLVWTPLYTGMGTASYLVWRDGGGFQGPAKLPLALYGVNLVLNLICTPIFFTAHRIGMALAEILLLWGSIGACAYTFWPINRIAAYLMIPYWACITVGTALLYCMWRDNKDKKD